MSFKGKPPVELSITRPRGSGVSVADDGDCADAATEAAQSRWCEIPSAPRLARDGVLNGVRQEMGPIRGRFCRK